MRQRFGVKYVPDAIRNSFHCLFVRRRVDVDNLAKFTLDAMNGTVYTDDVQVVRLVVTKVYDNKDDCSGRTEVKVTAIKNTQQLKLSYM